MRVVRCSVLGPPSVLEVVEIDDREPGADEVVIDIAAAGVNFVDALFVAGQYQIKPQPPFTPGSEIAGTIAAVGKEVTTLQVGDRVLASVGLGGYASRAVIRARSAVRIPDHMSFPTAATFPQSYATALFALEHRGHARSGETLLVAGAGGGVGLATIDVARALGLEVFAVASSEEKRQRAIDAGAHAAFDSAREDLKGDIRTASGGGVDLCLDPVGGAFTEIGLRSLREFGRLLIIGFAAGSIAAVPANQVLLRNRSVVGVDWGAWAMSHGPEQEGLLARLLLMVSDRTLNPHEPATFALDDAAGALDALIERRIVGKVALIP